MTWWDKLVSEMQRPGSIPSPPQSLSETGGPYNRVKLGLAMFLLGGLPLWWAVELLLSRHPLAQLAVLGTYGVAGMLWTMTRTRRILLQGGRHGTE